MIDVSSLPSVKVGIPQAFQERCVVRATKQKFAPNKKNKPMITTEWELVGYFDENGILQTQVNRGGVTYKLAGIRIQPQWFTLADASIPFYVEFWKKANPGETLTSIDEENPDIAYLDGLLMQAVCTGSSNPMKRAFTDEERKALVEEGKDPDTMFITDENGKPIEQPNMKITRFLARYFGEVPDDEQEAAA